MGETRAGFGERLKTAIAASSPLCVGIDPSSALLASWGLADDASGLETFGRSVVGAVAGIAAVVKPQVAFFERHGSQGFAALESVLADARDAGLLAIADAKRGDIDSTMIAYGEAWIGDDSPLRVDAMTVSIYLGLGAMEAVVDKAVATGRGLLVVVASSNPEGRVVQEAVVASGHRVEEVLLKDLSERNERECASSGRTTGSLGAVIGATRQGGTLPLASLHGPILIPGLGAQGATAHDVATLLANAPGAVAVASASRSILKAGPSHRDLREAAETQASELTDALC